MKLLYQLNAAFATLIIIIMSITAFFIYSLLMDMLIQDEQRQLKGRADLLVDIINEQDPERTPELSQLLQDRNYPILLFDRERDEVLFRTMPAIVAYSWVERYDKELVDQEVWETMGEKYVVYDFPVSRDNNQILVMATPMNDLQEVQAGFAARMVVVFLIGLLLAIIVSYVLTWRLVTPLTKLKQEVKKIEKRQFSDVKKVQASGEIKEVEQSLRHMASELSRYIHSQKQFFQNASHELKTPLMSIQGYAEGIRDGIFEGEAAEKGLNVMVSETERLKKIVNEMILLAKLDSSEDVYNPEGTEISEVIMQARDRLYPLANEKGINLTTEDIHPFYSVVDRERILQAMINILSNAVRHAKGHVAITTEAGVSHYRIKVMDDGPGIPEDLLPQLFERFIKGKEGETGLGLAISRAIIERSGGRIYAYNRSEQSGAVFEIEFNQKSENN
ncbi:Signal transduction histidine kinase [Halobacillus karajensis]|uniref:histidine kinase n=1 Tax=Halobacillus karajensis TaxID=195088 RepID=A0A024P4K5_9BACI|nr:HAMP domain-containing sensor histidine kinase [Halobacillus karajensis]CDQ18722.1 Sensor histidine kinase CssS [Halobacillus karajensis]CDQ23206.1 Sensor histidine kinase CssS [Halobacillus karajensis]CDQ26688.1 Sensor histidine kinase CssS [Halobacillus karajensis]SEH47532.1 Signal transduction histidine kinase [Halobacillus karajensis]